MRWMDTSPSINWAGAGTQNLHRADRRIKKIAKPELTGCLRRAKWSL